MARVTDKTELARLKQAVSNALPLLEQALSNASSHTQEESKVSTVRSALHYSIPHYTSCFLCHITLPGQCCGNHPKVERCTVGS